MVISNIIPNQIPDLHPIPLQIDHEKEFSEKLATYPKTINTLIRSGLSRQNVLEELRLGNQNLLILAEKEHFDNFAKICQLEGANKIILKLNPYKFFHFISKAREIEFICK